MRIGLTSIPYIKREKFFIDIKDQWNNYKLIDKGFGNIYVDKLNEESLQKEIDELYDELKKYNSIKDNIVCSTSPIDLIAKLIFAVEDHHISPEFCNKNLKTIHKMFNCLDVIFYIPISKFNEFNIPDKIPANEYYDEKFLNNIHTNLQDLFIAYTTRLKNPFFDVENCPAIIEVVGTDEQKIGMVKMFLNNDGTLKEPNIVLPQEDSEIINEFTKQLDNDLEETIKEKEKLQKLNSNNKID